MRRALVVAVATAVVQALVFGPAAFAAPKDDLARAQRRANEAAGRLARAEAALGRAEEQVDRARARATQAEGEVDVARSRVSQLALLRYVGTTVDDWRLLSMDDANESAVARVLTDIAAGESADALGRLRAEREDLATELLDVESKEKAGASALAALRAERTKAAAEVERLARQVRELEAKARRDATKAGAKPAVGSPASAAVGGGGWLCPVQGPHAFSDDYGDPRAGGRRHDGNDILSPRGTPVVASVAGTFSRNSSSLGGLSYYLKGDDGITYFGAHLDSYTGVQGRVSAGTQLGSVGNTGDARGGPTHLHFEMHPGGGASINPYSTLRKYC